MEINGLSVVNCELTSRCNKSCIICGRRRIEKENPNFNDFYNKEMDFSLVEHIASQVPAGIVVQLHNNGEPLMYSRFYEAVKLFNKQITNIVTNGKLLVEKIHTIIDNLDTLSISVFENDVEANEQFEIIKEFLELKGNRKPYTTLRLIGNVDRLKYESLGCQIITRILHSNFGSFQYTKETTIPEVGFCIEIISHIVIDCYGNVYPCVRFDPNKYNLLGNINEQSLDNIWNCEKRKFLIKEHVLGNRKCSKLCSKCEYYGIPRGE